MLNIGKPGGRDKVGQVGIVAANVFTLEDMRQGVSLKGEVEVRVDNAVYPEGAGAALPEHYLHSMWTHLLAICFLMTIRASPIFWSVPYIVTY